MLWERNDQIFGPGLSSRSLLFLPAVLTIVSKSEGLHAVLSGFRRGAEKWELPSLGGGARPPSDFWFWTFHNKTVRAITRFYVSTRGLISFRCWTGWGRR